jgi:hypothetical protein
MNGTDGFDPDRISYVSSFGEITARHPEPMLRATGKVLPALDRHCRAMIERSTFCVISSFGPHGADISPRGDPAAGQDRQQPVRYDGQPVPQSGGRHALPGAGDVGNPAH